MTIYFQSDSFPTVQFPKSWVRPPEDRTLRLEHAKGQNWQVAAWEITRLGSCHLGKCLWESS